MRVLSSGLMMLVAAVGDVPVMPDQYTLLCEGEQATGFNWVGGRWVKVNFTPDRHLVLNSGNTECAFGEVADNDLKGQSGFYSREICLNIRKFGTELHSAYSEKFREFYTLSDGKWAKQFACNDLFYNFEGNFEGEFRRIEESNVNPGAVRRDSMVLEIGKCSRIN